MSLISWIKSLRTKKETITDNIESIPILRTETPEKIIETRIKPIKIPTVVDIADRLGSISRHLIELREEIVSKSWFKSEYEDTGTLVIQRLGNIEKSLNTIQVNLAQTNTILSNFTNGFTKPKLSKFSSRRAFDTSIQILEILKGRNKMRYKDFITELGVSDPTLSKHLKTLVKMNKIRREKAGKAVFYQLISPDINPS